MPLVPLWSSYTQSLIASYWRSTLVCTNLAPWATSMHYLLRYWRRPQTYEMVSSNLVVVRPVPELALFSVRRTLFLLLLSISRGYGGRWRVRTWQNPPNNVSYDYVSIFFPKNDSGPWHLSVFLLKCFWKFYLGLLLSHPYWQCAWGGLRWWRRICIWLDLGLSVTPHNAPDNPVNDWDARMLLHTPKNCPERPAWRRICTPQKSS